MREESSWWCGVVWQRREPNDAEHHNSIRRMNFQHLDEQITVNEISASQSNRITVTSS